MKCFMGNLDGGASLCLLDDSASCQVSIDRKECRAVTFRGIGLRRWLCPIVGSSPALGNRECLAAYAISWPDWPVEKTDSRLFERKQVKRGFPGEDRLNITDDNLRHGRQA